MSTAMRSAVVASVAALSIFGVGVAADASSSSSYPTASSSHVSPKVMAPLNTFMIASNLNNRCLSTGAFNNGAGAAVYVLDCNGQSPQLWFWDGAQIRTAQPGNRCLDIAWANGDNGAAIQLWDCNGGQQQQWYWNGAQLANRLNNRCIAIDNANNWNGAAIHMWDCVNPSHEQWHTV